MEIPIVNCRRCRGPGVDFGNFSRFFIYFRREKCFSNLSGPISTRNFTGNPFLMVSERYGNAKFVKSRKNPKKIAKLENPANPLSRSSPDATVDTPCAAGARSDGIRQHTSLIQNNVPPAGGLLQITSVRAKLAKRCRIRADLEGY